jgi:hypothetical protein
MIVHHMIEVKFCSGNELKFMTHNRHTINKLQEGHANSLLGCHFEVTLSLHLTSVCRLGSLYNSMKCSGNETFL